MSIREPVTHEPARNRFEVVVEGVTAYAEYEMRGRVRVFTHTIVPGPVEGRGVATALVSAALNQTRAEGLQVLPRCSFVVDFLAKHPEYEDLLAPGS